MVYLSIAISVLIVLGLGWLERRAGGKDADRAINLLAWLLNIAAGFTVYTLFSEWQGPSLLRGADLAPWLAVVLYVLVQDFAEWLYHRAQHKLPFLWAMHSLHHSDPEMSALTTTRHFWADRSFKTLTVWSLAAMVISPTVPALLVYFGLSFWNYVAHANLRWDFGWWSWVINSPAYHRRHHSSLPEHYDSNFAALFPVWDVVFGSYHRPDGYPPTGFERRPRSLRELVLWPLVGKRVNSSTASSPLMGEGYGDLGA
jgi:sterol desaturase/sphingolipid hydroxylase (fatty acid hydroxylase superfamily)